jgi:hypothetical protein
MTRGKSAKNQMMSEPFRTGFFEAIEAPMRCELNLPADPPVAAEGRDQSAVSCPAMTELSASQKRKAWWYACWVFLPLLWLIPSMSVEYWPPVYAMFVLDVCACSVGVVAAFRTLRTSHSAGLRAMSTLLGSLYFLYIAVAGVFDLATLVKVNL